MRLLMRKLRELARELSEQKDEIGMDEETLMRMFLSKGMILAQ